MALSILTLVLDQFHVHVLTDNALSIVKNIHFSHLLLDCLLSYLLFAGAFTIDIDALKEQKWEIGLLASFSTLASAALVAVSSHYLLAWIGIDLPWIYACLFGALISPTDPIAVLATFKKVDAPRWLNASVAGESLFNDGVGIVIFTTLYQVLTVHSAPQFGDIMQLFLRQAVGGMLYGCILGAVAVWLCEQTDDAQLILLATLGIVTGGYTLALSADISGPLAMVVAGIWVGRGLRKSKHFHFLEMIWETIDEVLNAILFLLIGFELLAFTVPTTLGWSALLFIPLVLAIRWLTVGTALITMPPARRRPKMVTLLTWGGLRGGLAIALALALPQGQVRDIILTLTYSIVAFSVIVQGVSMKSLVKRYYKLN